MKVEIQRIAIDTVSWTPVPLVAKQVWIRNDSAALKFRSNSADSTTEDQVAATVQLVLKSEDRFVTPGTVIYVQAVSGVGPAIVTKFYN